MQKYCTLCFLLILGFGCETPDQGPSDAPDSGVRTDVVVLAQEARPATVDECPNGGVALDIGVDTNGNGVLDPDEVTRQEVVCNGRDGAETSA